MLYARHARTILAFLAARTRSAEDAADLMGETFAAALLGAARFRRSRGPALAWLFGIARHKLADSRRRGRVETAAREKLGLERLELDDEALVRVAELVDRPRPGCAARARAAAGAAARRGSRMCCLSVSTATSRARRDVQKRSCASVSAVGCAPSDTSWRERHE
ncbi:MAG: hypothetical protein LC777_17905 [Actinobacteria bacterium]|nr:hypothetical protein [Actinomycetota bacterium]